MNSFLFVFQYYISAAISLWIGFIAWRRTIPGSRLFSVIAFSEAIWAFGFALQITAPDLAGKLFWNNIQFLGAVFAPLFYFGFALEYSHPSKFDNRISSWKRIILLAFLLLIVIWTDHLHGYFRGQVEIVPDSPFNRLVFSNGPAFTVFTIYMYTLLVCTSIVFLSKYIYAEQLYRIQIGIVLTATLIPWIISLLSYFSVIPYTLHESTPAMFGLSNLIIAWAIFRYRLFDLVPVGRNYLIDNIQEGLFVLDSDLRIVDLNPAACQILGVEKTKAIGRTIMTFQPFHENGFNGLSIGESKKSEVKIQREGFSGLYELETSFMQGCNGGPGIYLAALRDIRDRKKAEEKLQYLAVTDPLTGVYNRRQVIDLAGGEIARSRTTGNTISVILLDVDNLKPVNDSAGHLAGDRVLEEVARRCQENLRSQDIFGRYGGDEFIAILPDTSPETALHVAERLRKQIEGFSIPGRLGRFYVTISIGVTVIKPDGPTNLDTLLEQADRALYRAKEGGRNRVVQY